MIDDPTGAGAALCAAGRAGVLVLEIVLGGGRAGNAGVGGGDYQGAENAGGESG